MKYGEGSEVHMFGKESSHKQCSALESKLVEYLDGRARPADRHAVEEHLSGCASCRLLADEFRALSSVLDELPAISPSPSFDASLRTRIAAEPVRRGFWDWLPSPRLAFAVTSLVAVSVWMASTPRVTTKPTLASHAIQSIHAIEESKVTAESDFGMIRDLPVLENFDVISKFDALSELPVSPAASKDGVVQESR
jgi:anti-sigma factor RsiW